MKKGAIKKLKEAKIKIFAVIQITKKWLYFSKTFSNNGKYALNFDLEDFMSLSFCLCTVFGL